MTEAPQPLLNEASKTGTQNAEVHLHLAGRDEVKALQERLTAETPRCRE